jgi:tRNA(Arg) A34 adenosine deaminase TadA
MSVVLNLPSWVLEETSNSNHIFTTLEEKMKLAIRLSQRNIFEGTGGPFGACVFEIDSGKLVSVGVNIVVPGMCSVAHAEMMAIMMAEQKVRIFDLGAEGLPDMELVTSAQPCIQCFGGLHWSGLRRLVFGATCKDVERLTGFDEGPLPSNWRVKLTEHNPPIEIIPHILRKSACKVLKAYEGLIYNANSGNLVNQLLESQR